MNKIWLSGLSSDKIDSPGVHFCKIKSRTSLPTHVNLEA
jgi:hypothetical protein